MGAVDLLRLIVAHEYPDSVLTVVGTKVAAGRTKSGSDGTGRRSALYLPMTDQTPGQGGGLPNTIAAKVGSSRLAIFEALAANDLLGMVIPEIVRASGVPKSTVHRVMEDFQARGLVVQVGRRRKAPVFRLNPGDEEVVHVSRALSSYHSWRMGKELEAYRRQERVSAQKLRMISAGAAARQAGST